MRSRTTLKSISKTQMTTVIRQISIATEDTALGIHVWLNGDILFDTIEKWCPVWGMSTKAQEAAFSLGLTMADDCYLWKDTPFTSLNKAVAAVTAYWLTTSDRGTY
jgi:hypothetical protein